MSALSGLLKRKPPVLWLWSGICAGLSVVLLFMLLGFFGSGDDEVLDALTTGQRIVANLATGEVSGNARQTLPDELPDSGFAQPQPPSAVTPAASSADTSPPPVALPPTPEGSDGLAKPDQALMQENPHGLIPVKASDGRKPWEVYAREAPSPAPQAAIALMITGLGPSKAILESALQLPPDVSFSFSPYAKDIAKWVELARARGHEAWLELPAEPEDFPASDPGPYGLLTSLSIHENIDRAHQAMAVFPGFVGAVLPRGEQFSRTPAPMRAMVQELEKRGVLLLISDPARSDEFYAGYPETVLPTGMAVDQSLVVSQMAEQFLKIEQRARKEGVVVATARALPVTLGALKVWVKELAKKKIALIPLSAARRP